MVDIGGWFGGLYFRLLLTRVVGWLLFFLLNVSSPPGSGASEKHGIEIFFGISLFPVSFEP